MTEQEVRDLFVSRGVEGVLFALAQEINDLKKVAPSAPEPTVEPLHLMEAGEVKNG